MINSAKKVLGGKMSYKLEYNIDGINATARNNDPKVLRELISVIEKAKGKVSWKFYNDGGIMLDSSEEQEEERKKKKK